VPGKPGYYLDNGAAPGAPQRPDFMFNTGDPYHDNNGKPKFKTR